MSSARTKGRPPKAVVTREKLADAALRIISASGYDALTMASIARELGVATSALYNHVSGKGELLLIVQDAVMGMVDTSALDRALAGEESFRAALAAWARSYRDVFASHTPLIEIIAVMPIKGAVRTTAMYEQVTRVLLAAGVPEPEVLPRLVAIESFIYGSVYDLGAPADIFAAAPDVAPTLDRLGRLGRLEQVDHRNPNADAAFAVGLDALLTGISTA